MGRGKRRKNQQLDERNKQYEDGTPAEIETKQKNEARPPHTRKRSTKAQMTEFRQREIEMEDETLAEQSNEVLQCKRKVECLSGELNAFKQNFKSEIKNFSRSFEKKLEHAIKPTVVIISTDSAAGSKVEKYFAGKSLITSNFENNAIDSTKINSMATPETEKLKVLRKFRPPISKSKMRKSEMAEKTEPEASFEKPKKPTYADKPTQLLAIETFFEFRLINSWLASKNSSWSSKEMNCLSEQLLQDSLISTYKCMGEKCSYTTISEKNFKTHHRCHENSGKIQRFLLNCPYCFFKGDCSNDLLLHYKDHHRHDKFQCAYCFYRSVDPGTTWEHINSHHKDQENKMYECPLEEAPKIICSNVKLLLNRKKFVPHFPCSGCRKFFFIIASYVDHLTEHLKDSATKSLANYDFSIFEKRQTENVTGRFQCLYCVYGANDRGEMRSHLQQHPREPVFVCDRLNSGDHYDPEALESTIVFELSTNKELNVISFDNSDQDELNILRNREKAFDI